MSRSDSTVQIAEMRGRIPAARSRPSCAGLWSLKTERAQGMPGDDLAHGPPAAKKAGGSHHRFSQIIRHSLRDGFNGVLRALPGNRAFLLPSLAISSILRA